MSFSCCRIRWCLSLADGVMVVQLVKKKSDRFTKFLCHSSHIYEPISVESRLGVRVKTRFLVLSHGFLMFWQLKPGQNNCKDSDSPCGESKPSIRSSSRDRLTDVSTQILGGGLFGGGSCSKFEKCNNTATRSM